MSAPFKLAFFDSWIIVTPHAFRIPGPPLEVVVFDVSVLPASENHGQSRFGEGILGRLTSLGQNFHRPPPASPLSDPLADPRLVELPLNEGA